MIRGMTQISEGTFKIDEVCSIIVHQDQVAATLKFSAQRDSAEMSMSGLDIMTIRNGQIKEVWLYCWDLAVEDAFGENNSQRAKVVHNSFRSGMSLKRSSKCFTWPFRLSNFAFHLNIVLLEQLFVMRVTVFSKHLCAFVCC